MKWVPGERMVCPVSISQPYMNKLPWSVVSARLDRFFFEPFTSSETAENRSVAVEEYLKISRWTWTEVLDSLWLEDKN